MQNSSSSNKILTFTTSNTSNHFFLKKVTSYLIFLKKLVTRFTCLEMFQHILRVVTLKLASRNCLRDLQTTLVMKGGSWSQNLCDVF